MNVQGQLANISGKQFENIVEEILIKYNISYKKQVPYITPYKTKGRRDFVINNTIPVECKFQKVRGSVDEKLPYVMSSLSNGILVIDGQGFRKGAIDWCKEHKGNNKVFSTLEFENYIKESFI